MSSRLGLQNTLTASLQRDKTLRLSILDMTQNNRMVRLSDAGALGKAKYPFIAIAHRST